MTSTDSVRHQPLQVVHLQALGLSPSIGGVKNWGLFIFPPHARAEVVSDRDGCRSATIHADSRGCEGGSGLDFVRSALA
jgi:hypothetical protein